MNHLNKQMADCSPMLSIQYNPVIMQNIAHMNEKRWRNCSSPPHQTLVNLKKKNQIVQVVLQCSQLWNIVHMNVNASTMLRSCNIVHMTKNSYWECFVHPPIYVKQIRMDQIALIVLCSWINTILWLCNGITPLEPKQS